MRLKNVKNASEIISKSSYVILDPFNYKGKWRDLFKNDNVIDVEIGMGKGDFIIQMAKQNPNVNYVGIEMYDSVIVRAAEKLENESLSNLKLIRMDANYISDVFEKEVGTIYLNFSDPWPKKRHAKRRLTSHDFLKKYDLVFKDKKIIEQKTDNIYLFAFSLESLSTYGYTLEHVTMDLQNDDGLKTPKSEYEKKFMQKGVKICMAKASKN